MSFNTRFMNMLGFKYKVHCLAKDPMQKSLDHFWLEDMESGKVSDILTDVSTYRELKNIYSKKGKQFFDNFCESKFTFYYEEGEKAA